MHQQPQLSRPLAYQSSPDTEYTLDSTCLVDSLSYVHYSDTELKLVINTICANSVTFGA